MADRLATLRRDLEATLDASRIALLEDGLPALGLATPLIEVTPETVEDVSRTLAVADATRAPVLPVGRGSALHLGNLPAEAEIVLSTRKLNATLDFEPADLTASVQVGKTLKAFQAELAEEGQRLALDPPNRERATLGGILATNRSGPMRRAFGTPRDLCLGVTAVLGDGTIIRSGRRVMKNVAGYDVAKLFIGSLGTLGVLVEAIFRLHPKPPEVGGIVGTFASWEAAGRAAGAVIRSELRPTFLEVHDLADGDATVLVGFEGTDEEVRYGRDRATALLTGDGDGRVDALEGEPLREAHETLLAAIEETTRNEEALVCRIGTTIDGVVPTREALRRLAERADIGVQSISHVACGIVYGLLRPSATTPTNTLVEMVERLRKMAASLGGCVVVESAPASVRVQLDVWGPPSGPLGPMRSLKRQFDPHGLLNRGRFVRGVDPDDVPGA